MSFLRQAILRSEDSTFLFPGLSAPWPGAWSCLSVIRIRGLRVAFGVRSYVWCLSDKRWFVLYLCVYFFLAFNLLVSLSFSMYGFVPPPTFLGSYPCFCFCNVLFILIVCLFFLHFYPFFRFLSASVLPLTFHLTDFLSVPLSWHCFLSVSHLLSCSLRKEMEHMIPWFQCLSNDAEICKAFVGLQRDFDKANEGIMYELTE